MGYAVSMKHTRAESVKEKTPDGERTWRVGELAKLAGVSVRTLHHYDAIGLLKPSGRSNGDYREYHRADLLRLQQILFYRELDMPLDQIKCAVDAPGFDICAALQNHRRDLISRQQRLSELISTVDRTLLSLTTKENDMKDHEYYQGFIAREQAEQFDQEARRKYGNDKVDESWSNIRKMGRPAFQELLRHGETINARLAQLMTLDPASAEVQAVIAEHHAYIGRFYTVTPEIYEGLADMYTADPRFTAYYEKTATGLARFISAGMKAFLAGQQK